MRKKILLVLIILIISLIVGIGEIYAADISGIGSLDSYNATSERASEKFKQKANMIVNVIRVVGTVTSVVMLMGIGFKYMTGSVEEKADYKSSLMVYVMGAFLIFTGSLLPQFIYDLSKNIK